MTVNRFDERRRTGSKDRWDDVPFSDSQRRFNDVMSKAAERWIAAFLGASTSIIDADKPDRGFDLIVPATGDKADVKWTSTYPGKWYGNEPGYPTLNLSTWKPRARVLPTIYIFTCGESVEELDRYSWAFGYATRAELLAAPIVTGKYGKPFHALGFDYLHPLDDLLPLPKTYDDIPDEALG